MTIESKMTKAFDAAIATISDQRGEIYNHPSIDFMRVTKIKEAVKDCPDPVVRHALEMIGVKMARLTTTPDHLDSIIDIAGYARTIVMHYDRLDLLAQGDAVFSDKPQDDADTGNDGDDGGGNIGDIFRAHFNVEAEQHE